MPLDGLLHRAFGVCGAAGVGDDEPDGRMVRRGGLQRGLAASGDDHAGALRREAPGGGPADAGATAGDEDHGGVG
ncbi:hypothetical protein GCM10007918_46720 [Piscinibacter gummiphilus]|nr:hypothetical protein GCM10007918_46720 [Piscinibacter gummiphilus]